MHLILVIVVWFVTTAGVSKPSEPTVLEAPPGTTVAECEAYGSAIAAKARLVDGVRAVASGCVNVVERIAS